MHYGVQLTAAASRQMKKFSRDIQ